MIAMFLIGFATAAPVELSHQGRLVDATGAVVHGTHDLTFGLYTAAVGGPPVWTETQTLLVADGYFSAQLGAAPSNPIDDSDLSAPDLWVGVALDGQSLGPRAPLASVPYARRADVAATASSVSGSVRVGASSVACDQPAHQGQLRWDGTSLDLCTADGWVYVAGRRLGASPERPGANCLEIFAADPNTDSGVYWIRPSGTGAAFQAYCDMEGDGGGWTLVARMHTSSGQAHWNTGAVNLPTTGVALNNGSTQKFSDTTINAIRASSTATDSTAYRMTCWEGTSNLAKMFCSRSCTFNATNSVNTSECSRCTGTVSGTLVQLTPNTGTRGLGHHHDTSYPWSMAYQRHPEEGSNPGCRNDAKGSGNGHLWVR
jgi:hypothetical protein